MAYIGKVILLAVLQGITEFLPISSSGHLVIAKALIGLESMGVGLEVSLHLGTTIAILIFYWTDLRDLIVPIFKEQGAKRRDSLRFIWLLAAATVPAGLVGLIFNDRIEALFSNAHFVGITLIATAAILAATALSKRRKKPFNLPRALTVGMAQAMAILPGISRSGSTIATGELLGVESADAARFSFILAIPVILGAAMLEAIGGLNELRWEYAIGLVVSAVVGYFSLRLMIGIVKANRLWAFAPYCLAVGLVTLIFM